MAPLSARGRPAWSLRAVTCLVLPRPWATCLVLAGTCLVLARLCPRATWCSRAPKLVTPAIYCHMYLILQSCINLLDSKNYRQDYLLCIDFHCELRSADMMRFACTALLFFGHRCWCGFQSCRSPVMMKQLR